jgi:hypothetical protein
MEACGSSHYWARAIAAIGHLALCRAMLAQNAAGKSLGDVMRRDHALHASTATRGI